MTTVIICLEIATTCLLAILLLNKDIFHLFSEIASKIYPMPLLGGIIGTCLLFIAFIISFHSNVFTDNDKYSEGKEFSGARRNGYDWLSLADVYKFPINQLLLDSYFVQENTLDFAEKSKDSTNYHLVIVDKTRSTTEDKNTALLLMNAKILLRDKIKRVSPSSAYLLDKLNTFADILAIAAVVDALEQGRPRIVVGLYHGRNMGNKTFIDNISYKRSFEDESDNIESFIKDYTFKVSQKQNLQNSDFEDMLREVTDVNLNEKQREERSVTCS